MASQLPAIPKFVFLVFEPITLLAGWATATFNPIGFVSDQISDQITGHPAAVNDHARLLALHLGNSYGLMFLIALVVLYTTSELKVIRRYLMALSFTEITHVAIAYYVLGWDNFTSFGQWNTVMWCNIILPMALFLMRVTYLLGLFESAKVKQPRGKSQ